MGINYVCNPVPDRTARNIKIFQETARRLNMEPVTPVEQIRKAIEHHENEAKWARENAESALARAESEEQAAAQHESHAEQWRRILAREERAAADERTVTVKLEADVSGFIASVERAAEAFRAATDAGRLAHGGIHRFAEPQQPWESFISGRPGCQRVPCSGSSGCICGRHGDGRTKDEEHD